jgi:hypothetical protein
LARRGVARGIRRIGAARHQTHWPGALARRGIRRIGPARCGAALAREQKP